ncbi:MAG: 2'-5' RNA ligase family protein [Gaiellaceae bacterium]
MPRTALIVAVPEAEPLVQEWRLRWDNASLGIPAHITLIFPFVPVEGIGEELMGGLRELFAAQPSFAFSLARVARFPEHAWLAPEPNEPFRRLTALLAERYPEHPPYEGIHDEVIPHLTVVEGDMALQDKVDAALTPHLPIAAEVREVTLLLEDESGHWRPGEVFPLGA